MQDYKINPYLRNFLDKNNISYNLDTTRFKEFLEIKRLEKELEELAYSPNLTDEDKKQIYLIHKNLITRSYFSYFKDTWPAANPLIYGKHIELICDILTMATMGIIKTGKHGFNLIVNMPPRHLKSTSITNRFPSWFMLKKHKMVIVATYGDSLASKAGAMNKEFYEKYQNIFFQATPIDPSVKAKNVWQSLESVHAPAARFIATSMQGKATGEGADLLIIDDPIKNRADANSETQREKIYDTWSDDLKTRLHPNNNIAIILMTRWHADDLVGRLEQDTSMKWAKLIMRGEIETEADESEDILMRKMGDVLWPEAGFDNEYFDSFRKNPRTWNSLIQQRPIIDGGSYFKEEYFRYAVEDGPIFLSLEQPDGSIESRMMSRGRKFITVDAAAKEKDENDETAICVWYETEKHELVLWDLYHGRLDFTKQEDMIEEYAKKYDILDLEIEDASNGTGLISRLSKKGYRVKGRIANRDKVTRSERILDWFCKGNVYFHRRLVNITHDKSDMPKNVLEYMKDQLVSFPTAKHDDIVDAVAWAGYAIADIIDESNHGLMFGG